MTNVDTDLIQSHSARQSANLDHNRTAEGCGALKLMRRPPDGKSRVCPDSLTSPWDGESSGALSSGTVDARCRGSPEMLGSPSCQGLEPTAQEERRSVDIKIGAPDQKDRTAPEMGATVSGPADGPTDEGAWIIFHQEQGPSGGNGCRDPSAHQRITFARPAIHYDFRAVRSHLLFAQEAK
jgi:hypothetical protein